MIETIWAAGKSKLNRKHKSIHALSTERRQMWLECAVNVLLAIYKNKMLVVDSYTSVLVARTAYSSAYALETCELWDILSDCWWKEKQTNQIWRGPTKYEYWFHQFAIDTTFSSFSCGNLIYSPEEMSWKEFLWVIRSKLIGSELGKTMVYNYNGCAV